jgi:uncharacterized cupredoxin-like copper-binding protein
MRARFPYMVLLTGALVALVGSAAWAATRDGRSLGRHGMRAASCAPTSLEGSRVDVRLMGMDRGAGMMGGSMMGEGRGMMLLVVGRTAVPAGRVSFVARNMGGAVHELVVLPLAEGQSAGQRAIGGDERVGEAGSLGEASRSCGAGPGEGIDAGAVGWVTLDLKPGRYELVCNLRGHYGAGMYATLDVE